MQTTDPLTMIVTSCVAPAALTACLLWSLYLLAAGAGARATPSPIAPQTARPLANGSTPIRRPVAAR
jgi:hypothetical protein